MRSWGVREDSWNLGGCFSSSCSSWEEKKQLFSTSSLIGRDATGCRLQKMHCTYPFSVRTILTHQLVNVNMNPHLWLWCYGGVGEREGDAGGFRSEDFILWLFWWRGCDFLAHMLVNDITSSWERTELLKSKSNSLVTVEAMFLPCIYSWWNYLLQMPVNKQTQLKECLGK